MLFLKRIPKLLRWIVSVQFVFLLVMTVYRYIFYLNYHPAGKPFSGSAFLMGLRFDIKFTSIVSVVMLLLTTVLFINPFKRNWAKKIWNILLPLLFIIVLLFYVTDYYYYDYLQQRLNASVLNYFQDAAISMNMVWESYPVIKMTFVLLFFLLAGIFIFKKLLQFYETEHTVNFRKGTGWYILFFLLFALGVFGKMGQFNLRWSDAFTLQDNFKANLSLNPFQSFFSTLNYRNTKPDIQKTRANYALMSNYFGIAKPDSTALDFQRNIPAGAAFSTKPNVVLVICESFSMYKSSMSGNPLDATPFFNELCKKGVFFNRCFTPSFPTARGVWATVTGIPDVLGDNNRSASRNPETVNQHIIANDFTGYEKFYFLGGDPTWANIKGLLLNNIDSLQLYSQENFKAKKVDVWGIDDKNLFLEANKMLAQQQKPFFSIIQTADNHRPYTIPEADLVKFKKRTVPLDSLQKYGFENLEQYNAFRYTDFCYQQFFEAVEKEKYFNNTLFVFVGDHGIPGNALSIYPKSYTEQVLTQEHVPLLFYAPGLLKPQLINRVCSQIDIMPTIGSFLKLPYTNNSMGINLFDSANAEREYAFIINNDTKNIGTVTNKYYYIKNNKTGVEQFVSILDNNPVPVNAQTDSMKKQLSIFTTAYYETAKYLLFNNKKRTSVK